VPHPSSEIKEAARLSLVEELVGLSRADWKYADPYLWKAEAVMAPLCPRKRFRNLMAQRNRVGTRATDLRRAIQPGD